MDQLEIGDLVLVDIDKYSEIFFFSHKSSAGIRQLMRLEIENRESILLTKGHCFYVANKNKLVAGGYVEIGDQLTLSDGRFSPVISKSIVYERGLHNPHTLDGYLVVNHIQASCYTQAVIPWLAKLLLRPLYWSYKLNLNGIFHETFFDDDRSALASWMLEGQ